MQAAERKRKQKKLHRTKKTRDNGEKNERVGRGYA